MNKNKAKIIISIIVLIITIIISFNKAYSFYNAKVIKENETETLLSSKKLELIFEDTLITEVFLVAFIISSTVLSDIPLS